MTDSKPISRRTLLRTVAAALVLPALEACRSPSEAELGGSPRLTARPATPILDPPLGLTPLGLGGSRDGLLYVPQSYVAGAPIPLFVALHGAGGEAQNWQSYFARAEQRGFVLLAPDSRRTTWDLVHGEFGEDVNFIDAAIEYTFDRVRIDPARLALAGFSDGASYSLSLGLANGDLFSHVLAYSPGFRVPPRTVARRPRVFISHGNDDSVLPVTQSRAVIVPELRAEGYDVQYVEFAGGHEVPAEISEQALDWFMEQGSAA
jgi:phospholipase/carboxylesterase